MRGAGLALLVVVALLAPAAPSASAHPLGNFSINHLSAVRVSHDRLEVHYVLDQAEIPTLDERDLGRAAVLRRKLTEVRRRLALTVDGRPLRLHLGRPGRLSYRDGAAGLKTLRVELDLSAPAHEATRVVLRDGTFPGRVGWKAIVARPGEGTAVRTAAPSGDPTDGLRRYPKDVLNSPLDRRDASFSVRPGDGTLVAPAADGGGGFSTTRAGGEGEGFAALFSDAASGQGVLILLLAAAFGWGALHALSPGHGKAMVAAYLVGTRGTAKHALALGATVTITHTIGVFALGVVALALSQYVLPEDLYPWLTLVSALMVVAVGAGVLRSRVRRARAAHAEHHHHHHGPEELSWRGLLGLGTAAGLVPCPSALVVLLAAVSQHEVALGLLLIVAFSLGLAATLTALGVAVVHARRLLPRGLAGGRLVGLLPSLSALLIVGVGCLLTLRAVPGWSEMHQLDAWLSGLFDGAPLLVALAIALVLGLRHASDPDHLMAVTSLVAADGGGTRRAAGLGAWWGAGHAAVLLLIGLPLIFFKGALPAWLESGAERAVGVVILLLAARVIVKWMRGDYRAGAHAHARGHGRRRHLRRGHGRGHRHVRVRSPQQAFSIGVLHGLAGTGAVVLLLLASLPTQVEAAAALAVFAPMTVVSMALCTTAFSWVLTRPLVEPVYRSVLIPALGLLGLVFGVWYVGGA